MKKTIVLVLGLFIVLVLFGCSTYKCFDIGKVFKLELESGYAIEVEYLDREKDYIELEVRKVESKFNHYFDIHNESEEITEKCDLVFVGEGCIKQLYVNGAKIEPVNNSAYLSKKLYDTLYVIPSFEEPVNIKIELDLKTNNLESKSDYLINVSLARKKIFNYRWTNIYEVSSKNYNPDSLVKHEVSGLQLGLTAIK